jgi:hypothetical protein
MIQIMAQHSNVKDTSLYQPFSFCVDRTAMRCYEYSSRPAQHS